MKLNLKLLFGTITLIVVFNFSVYSQVWSEMGLLPTEKSQAMSFSIGDKGYLFGGINMDIQASSKLWEWDQATDTWIEKTSLPGTNGQRMSGVAFSIGNKGYVATGYDSGMYNDLWEWDQLTDTWTQKASIPSGARGQSSSFVIGTKAYIAGGFDSNYSRINEVWEWNQATDTWTQKANLPAAVSGSASFSIENKGYVVGGFKVDDTYNEKLWEFDTLNNTWTEKASIPVARGGCIGFSYDGDGYVSSGEEDNYLKDLWKWNALSNSWQQLTDLPGGTRARSSSFIVGDKAYILGGAASAFGIFNEMWQLDFGTTASISKNELSESISIYPNPASTSFSVNFSDLNEKTNLKVVDLLGKIVFELSDINPSIKKSIEIKTADFIDGTYFIQIQSNDKVLTEKLVIRN